jgi:hypothetical protein
MGLLHVREAWNENWGLVISDLAGSENPCQFNSCKLPKVRYKMASLESGEVSTSQ